MIMVVLAWVVWLQDISQWGYQRRKEGNVSFNDALNTFHFRLYGVGHMVKNQSDSEEGNQLPPLHRHVVAFLTPIVENGCNVK